MNCRSPTRLVRAAAALRCGQQRRVEPTSGLIPAPSTSLLGQQQPTVAGPATPEYASLCVRGLRSGTKNADTNREIILRVLEGEDSGVATLTFNRPKAANAIGTTMLSQMQEAIGSISGQDTGVGSGGPDLSNDVRCVVLTSSTARVFSAGADLRERSEMSQDEAAAFVTELRGAFDRMASLPVPVLAAVEGVAVGGGLEIALTADLIVAGEDAKFGLPETSLAIIPGAGGTQRLPRLIGLARAKELIYTARRIDARTAYEYNLVQHVVPPGEAESKAMEIAREIAKNGPLALRAAKSSINGGLDAPNMAKAMEIERQCYQRVIPTKDRLEGLAAFREGRKPQYKGE